MFPKKYGPTEIPSSVQTLLTDLMPRLIEGAHPALAALREQYRVATVKEVELTGAGVYVDFEVPSGVPLTDPPGFVGGHADIVVSGLKVGCVLYVQDGRLATLECYSFGEEAWTEDANVVRIDAVVPIVPKPASPSPWRAE